MTRWPVEPLTFSKKNPSRAIPRSTYIHPPSLAKIGQRTSEEIGNKQTDKQTNAARFIVWYCMTILYDYITSDHMPVLIIFDLGKATIDLDSTDEEPSIRKIKWNKLSKEDLYQYHELTEHHLSGIRLNHELLLCDDPNCQFQAHQHSVDAMYNSIIQAMKISSKEFMQQRESSRTYNIIPGWNEFCREVHSNARDAFIIWAMNGRPRSGPLHRNMQITRATFKQALRRCKASESKAHADSLARKLLIPSVTQCVARCREPV